MDVSSTVGLSVMADDAEPGYCGCDQNPSIIRKRSEDGADLSQKQFSRSRLGALDGVRVISALIVALHHFPSLDTDVAGNGNNGRGRLLAQNVNEFENSLWGYLFLVPVGPGKIAVQTFLSMAGIVAAYPCWVSGSTLHYEKTLIKRFFRLAFPVIPVHVVNVFLYVNRIAYGNFNKFPAEATVKDSFSIGLASFFARELNGALWVLPYFLFSPFVALGIQYPVFRLRPAARYTWYCCCLTYLVGNVYEESTISMYFPVAVGVLLSDVFANNNQSDNTAISICILLALMALFAPWMPGNYYAHEFGLILCATSFLFLAQFWKPLHMMMNNKPMHILSKYTFQLYIWHLVVFNSFGASITPKATTLMQRIFVYVSAYLCACFVAFVAYWCIEVPCGRLIDYFQSCFFRSEQGTKLYQSVNSIEENNDDFSKLESSGNLRNRILSPKKQKPSIEGKSMSQSMNNLFNSRVRSPRQSLLDNDRFPAFQNV